MPADSITPMGNQGPGPPIIPGTQVPNVLGGLAVPDPGAAQAAPKEISARTSAVEQEAALVEIQQTLLKAKGPSAPADVEEAAKALRDFLKNLPSDLQFRSDRETGRIIFKIINPVTREVIRQYPPEEILQMARRLRATIGVDNTSGVFLDKEL